VAAIFCATSNQTKSLEAAFAAAAFSTSDQSPKSVFSASQRLRSNCSHTAGFTVTASPSNITPPDVPAGLPSALLQRRPDIVEAEQLLEASSARIGVAKAAFFPTIKLTSTAGLASADLGTFLNWPSRVWSVGPSIHVPIFEGGRNRANLKAAEARYE
jgi:multidrug efflux system outer membrane protein